MSINRFIAKQLSNPSGIGGKHNGKAYCVVYHKED